jgi:hypothetical protein
MTTPSGGPALQAQESSGKQATLDTLMQDLLSAFGQLAAPRQEVLALLEQQVYNAVYKFEGERGCLGGLLLRPFLLHQLRLLTIPDCCRPSPTQAITHPNCSLVAACCPAYTRMHGPQCYCLKRPLIT